MFTRLSVLIFTQTILALLAVIACVRTATRENHITIRLDNNRITSGAPYNASEVNYDHDEAVRSLIEKYRQNAINLERNRGLPAPSTESDNDFSADTFNLDQAFTNPLLGFESSSDLRKRSSPPRIGRAELVMHPAQPNLGFDMWVGSGDVGGLTFNLAFDTAAHGLWVPAKDCNLKNKRKFDPSLAHSAKSLPFVAQLPVHRLIASREGSIGFTGRIIIGGKLSVHTIFWTVKYFKERFDSLPFDGVLGLGFPSLGKSYPGQSYLDSLYRMRKIPDRRFAFYLGSTFSEMHFLGIDPKCYEADTLEYYPVLPYGNDYTYWMIGNGKIKVNGHIIASSMETILDSVAGAIFGPPELVKKFYGELKLDVEVEKREGGEFYFFDCGPKALQFKLSFSWGQKEWDWTADQFILYKRPDGKCAGAVQPRPVTLHVKDGVWLFGTSFLRKVYSVFNLGNPNKEPQDPPQVGFAQLKEKRGKKRPLNVPDDQRHLQGQAAEPQRSKKPKRRS